MAEMCSGLPNSCRHAFKIIFLLLQASVTSSWWTLVATTLHIQAHNDSTVKVCVDNDTLLTGASGVTEMHTSGTGTTGVKIYFDEADGDRWYLRVYLNSADEEVVELVSQSYVNNVSTNKHTQCCGLCNVIVFERLVIVILLLFVVLCVI